jgi:VanZ family protein
MKAISAAYFLALTYLLVVKRPLAFIESDPGLGALSRDLVPVAHLVSFALLAVLTSAARWPIPRWGQWGLLVAYAMGTELVQAFLPWRTAELGDFLQDLAGIAAGLATWRLAAWLLGRWPVSTRRA